MTSTVILLPSPFATFCYYILLLHSLAGEYNLVDTALTRKLLHEPMTSVAKNNLGYLTAKPRRLALSCHPTVSGKTLPI